MDNKQENEYKQEVKEVSWREVEEESISGISFKKRKSRRERFVKATIKYIIFIVVAAISGSITATYIVNKKIVSMDKEPNEFVLNEPSFTEKDENSINSVAETVGPAVVAITNGPTENSIESNSIGSGIVFKQEGYIVTNYHVIDGLQNVYVKLSNGIDPILAQIIGKDSVSDLAVLKINVKNLPVAEFGDSDKVRVGDVAIAIGNPLGEKFSGTVTAGIISAINREIRYEDTIYNVMQTDAAINPGNSGGALCNIEGKIIGINSLKVSSSLNAEGMGFAIEINEAKEIIEQLIENGRVSRARVGIRGRTSQRNDSSDVQGVYIAEIIQDSGAKQAGLQIGDIIVKFDNNVITKFEELTNLVENHKVGDSVVCEVWRNNKSIKVTIQLKDFNE
ncbi:S1C family serine protease [Clostridium grantii]|uniref:S1C family serine protease n=1 Tax=Clostridium grantii TaxID=40575 RepID=UPI001FA84BC7|nr:trypsin-like peptidase domain-containing protein [Clostridium grantii]